MTAKNGTQKGRAVPPLTQFTFDTGVTVGIRKVSPLLQVEIRRVFPPPKPPLNQVDYGDGKTAMEPNDQDPAYHEELQRYNSMFEQKIRRAYIKRGVECEIDTDAVAQLRSEMADEGVVLDPDDKFVYISYICVGTNEDYSDLVEAITRRARPTEGAIAEAIETF